MLLTPLLYSAHPPLDSLQFSCLYSLLLSYLSCALYDVQAYMRTPGYIPFRTLPSLVLSIHSDSLTSAPCCCLLRLAHSRSISSQHAHRSLPSQVPLFCVLNLTLALVLAPCRCLLSVDHSRLPSSLCACCYLPSS